MMHATMAVLSGREKGSMAKLSLRKGRKKKEVRVWYR
jgi:hypothetical protein